MSGCSTPKTVTFQVPAYTPPQQQCTGGRTLVNGQCVCPSGTQEYNGQCMTPQQICQAQGKVWQNGQCVSPQPQGQPPAVPTGLEQINNSTTTVNVGWNPVSGATSYTYTDQYNFTNTLQGEYNIETTLSGIQPGSSFWFKVRANNQYGSSDWSSPIYLNTQQAGAPPPTPQPYANGSPYQDTNGDGNWTVPVAWNPVSGATSYIVTDNLNGYVTTPGTSANLTGVPPGYTLNVSVVAVNQYGQSGAGSLSVTTPSPPTSIDVYQNGSPYSNSDGTWTVPIAWNPVSGVSQYHIGDNLGGNFSTAGTYANLSGVPSGYYLTVTVTAVDQYGNSISGSISVSVPS